MKSAPVGVMPCDPSDNRRVVERLYHYFANREFHQLRDVFHEAIEWIQMEGFPNGGRYYGIDAIVRNVFNSFRQDWAGWEAITTAMIEAQDAVFVTGFYKGTYRATGKSFQAEFIHHYNFREGKIIRFQQYTDTARVVNATHA